MALKYKNVLAYQATTFCVERFQLRWFSQMKRMSQNILIFFLLFSHQLERDDWPLKYKVDGLCQTFGLVEQTPVTGDCEVLLKESCVFNPYNMKGG